MFSGIEGIVGAEQAVSLKLYTDAQVIRGTLSTRQRRVTDILNDAEDRFVVLTGVVLEEYATGEASRADYVQVNLDAVLFALADMEVAPVPELRTPKVPEQAMISIPPFRIVGRIHLLPERNLRDALAELTGRFLPVTDAVYWSDALGEARTSAPMVAFNHARAQILAPHREVNPWEGLDRGAGAKPAPDAIGDVPAGAASTSESTGSQDPWRRDSPSGGPPDTGVRDPWGPERRPAAGQEPSNPWGGPGGDPWRSPGKGSDDELIG
ncbi:MAG TPA: hypothetical protein VM344_06625 [Vitreimonas sp.]|nr:hypothetical protein [Vitreimonas sp.]